MDFYDAGNPGANGSEETTWNGDLQVGEWCFRPQIGEISMGEERIRPEPRVMDVLVYLAHHPGKVLPRERIIAAVWNSSFFSDEVLTNAISALRKAFRDDARNPSFIQTLPRRGYLWLAPTTIEVDSRGRYEARGSLQEWRERTRRLLSGAFLAVPILISTTMAIYHSMPTLAPVSFSLIRKREWRPGLNRFGQVPSSPVVRIRRRVAR